MRRRRQTGGLVPRRVTFRLTMLLPALLLGSTVLAMIAHHVAWMLRHHGFCAAVRPTASGLYSDRQRLLVEGQADGLQDRDAASSGSLEDGPDVGVEPGTPMRAEAVGDLAEDDAGAQRLFRPVVGRRHRPVGEEDEQVLPVLLDDSEQFLALPVGRLDLEQPVELGFQLRGINGESGRGEAVTPVADGYGLLQQVLDAGRKADVASVDGVLDIAQQMSKAGLVPGPCPTHLRAEPVRHPEIRAHRAEELADHRLATARPDQEASAVAIVKDPGPPRLLAEPRAGLVRLQDGAGQQPLADQAGLAREDAAA